MDGTVARPHHVRLLAELPSPMKAICPKEDGGAMVAGDKTTNATGIQTHKTQVSYIESIKV